MPAPLPSSTLGALKATRQARHVAEGILYPPIEPPAPKAHIAAPEQLIDDAAQQRVRQTSDEWNPNFVRNQRSRSKWWMQHGAKVKVIVFVSVIQLIVTAIALATIRFHRILYGQ